jgi:hypothetical protein
MLTIQLAHVEPFALVMEQVPSLTLVSSQVGVAAFDNDVVRIDASSVMAQVAYLLLVAPGFKACSPGHG